MILTIALLILVGVAAGYSYKKGFNEGIYATTERTVNIMKTEGLIQMEGTRIIPIEELLKRYDESR